MERRRSRCHRRDAGVSFVQVALGRHVANLGGMVGRFKPFPLFQPHRVHSGNLANPRG